MDLAKVGEQLLLYAVKEGAKPSEQDVETMIKNGPLGRIDGLQFLIHRFTSDELAALGEKVGAQTSKGFFARFKKPDRMISLQVAVLGHAGNLFREHGRQGQGSFDLVTLWRSGPENPPSMVLFGIGLH
jgi:hypothetical protein